MERKLASIRRIGKVEPIPKADAIEVVTIGGWKVVTMKDEFKVGDLCIYFEIDSFLPERPEYEFLRKSSFRKMADDSVGFRLKTIKLRGQISQGLAMPVSILNPPDTNIYVEPWEGLDVTNMLGVKKWEAPIPFGLEEEVKGGFPGFIPKTDEERIQNLTDLYEEYKEKVYYSTEKMDGLSTTIYYNDGYFGVLGRNWEYYETEKNTLWKLARQYDLENKLKELGNFAVQGECIGEGIQGNKYKLIGQAILFYNVFNINTQSYLSLTGFKNFIELIGLKTVPIISENYILPETVEQILRDADGKSLLNEKVEREGIVVRSLDRTISFKVISNEFLVNED